MAQTGVRGVEETLLQGKQSCEAGVCNRRVNSVDDGGWSGVVHSGSVFL